MPAIHALGFDGSDESLDAAIRRAFRDHTVWWTDWPISGATDHLGATVIIDVLVSKVTS